MAELPNEILQRWSHSFEEDTEDKTVYRPTSYQFPRARGRAGIEFREDGEFIDWIVSATDANRGVNGHWRIECPGYIHISFEGDIQSSRIFEIIEYDEEIFVVRVHPASP